MRLLCRDWSLAMEQHHWAPRPGSGGGEPEEQNNSPLESAMGELSELLAPGHQNGAPGKPLGLTGHLAITLAKSFNSTRASRGSREVRQGLS